MIGFGQQSIATNPRLAFLLRQRVGNRAAGSSLGPLAGLAQGLLKGYAVNKDQSQQQAAMEALMGGMKQPIPQPPIMSDDPSEGGITGIPEMSGDPYSRGLQALGGLKDNPYAGRLATQLFMKQAEQAAARQQADTDFERKKELLMAPRYQAPPKGQREFEYYQSLGPEDRALYDRFQADTGQAPANVQEWQFYNSLPAEDQARYRQMKRADKWLDLGDRFENPSPVPEQPQAFPKGLGPERKVQDDRVINLPAVSGGEPVMDQQGGTWSVGQGQPAYAPPTQTQGPSVQELPPSPGDRRKADEAAKQEEARQRQAAMYADVVTTDVDRAIDKITNATIPMTGAFSLTAAVPGTPAHDVSKLIDTIRANVGFDRLQQMRAASPTGGALGQVSEMENRLLQATIGNLEQSQTKDQLLYNLQRVKDLYLDIVHGPGNRPSQGAPEGSVDASGMSDEELMRQLNGQ